MSVSSVEEAQMEGALVLAKSAPSIALLGLL